MNVLSLFDGMSCGRIALGRAGIEVGKYYASELDKYAITVTQANWSETIQLGDVTKWREWPIDWASIDLLIGGSPCQGFSFAGKQLAFDDPRSALFFVYVDILNHIKSVNPDVKFMLENVKMKKEYLDVISSMLKVEPEFINSGLVSAQSRQRYYWANWDFGQPEDKGIVLADIIENPPTNLTIMSDKFTKRQEGRKFLVSEPKDKAVSFSSMEYVKNGRQGDYIGCDEKGYCTIFNKPVRTGVIKKGRQGERIYSDFGKSPTLLANPAGGNKPIYMGESNLNYRKLTPVECERLQTVPDNYTNHVSNTQRYKMLGNGWTVDVVAHIFKTLK